MSRTKGVYRWFLNNNLLFGKWGGKGGMVNREKEATRMNVCPIPSELSQSVLYPFSFEGGGKKEGRGNHFYEVFPPREKIGTEPQSPCFMKGEKKKKNCTTGGSVGKGRGRGG